VSIYVVFCVVYVYECVLRCVCAWVCMSVCVWVCVCVCVCAYSQFHAQYHIMQNPCLKLKADARARRSLGSPVINTSWIFCGSLLLPMWVSFASFVCLFCIFCGSLCLLLWVSLLSLMGLFFFFGSLICMFCGFPLHGLFGIFCWACVLCRCNGNSRWAPCGKMKKSTIHVHTCYMTHL